MEVLKFLLICLCFIVYCICDCYKHYPYRVSKKIMELSNVKQQEEIIGKQLGHNCYDIGPEEFAYPEKTYMLDYNYYIVVKFKSNCDLGDTVGFYKKSYYSCDDYWGCSMREYTYSAKLYKWQFKMSLLDLL